MKKKQKEKTLNMLIQMGMKSGWMKRTKRRRSGPRPTRGNGLKVQSHLFRSLTLELDRLIKTWHEAGIQPFREVG